ncbi:MAG: SPOR domain-containing protein [Chromatiales bacterium]|jgi:DedD protein|nr:SPOR domain-containing protein [Chromatiales bacterium]
MARDYKNRTQRQAEVKAAPATHAPGWIWLLTGLTMGLVVAVGAYMEGRYPGTIFSSEVAMAPVPDGGETAEGSPQGSLPATKTVRKLAFTFYSLLPDVEVEVENRPPPRATNSEAADNSTTEISVAPAQPKPVPAETMSKAEAVMRPKYSKFEGQGSLTNPPDALVPSQLTREATDITGQYMLQVASFAELAAANRLRGLLTLNGYDPLIQTVAIKGGNRHRVRLGPFGNKAAAEQAQAALARNQLNAKVLRIRG